MRVISGFLAALVVAVAAAFSPAAGQGVPITELPAATPQPGSLLPAVVNGVTSKITVQQLLNTSGVTLQNVPTNQFAPGVLVNGQCVYATSTTSISSASCASLFSGSYVTLSPGSQQTGFLNLGGSSTMGSLTANTVIVNGAVTAARVTASSPIAPGSGGTGNPFAPDAALVPSGSHNAICFGDSIAQGTGASTPANAWCAQAAAAFGYTAVNLGIGGTTMQNTSANGACAGVTRWNVEPPPDPNVAGCLNQLYTTTTSSITGSGSVQSVPVVSSAGIRVGATIVVSDTSPENVVVTAKADSTHVSGVFTLNHPIVNLLYAVPHSLQWYAQNDTGGLFALAYGINDVRIQTGSTPAFSPAQFAANYTTVINGLLAAGVKPDHIILVGISYSDPTNCVAGCTTPLQNFDTVKAQYNEQVARLAAHVWTNVNGITGNLRFAETYFAMSEGGGLTTLFDHLHPNNLGHAIIGAQVVSAAFTETQANIAAYKGLGALAAVDGNGCPNLTLTWGYLDTCPTDVTGRTIHYPLYSTAGFLAGAAIADTPDALDIGSTTSGGKIRVGTYSGTTLLGVTCSAMWWQNFNTSTLLCMNGTGSLSIPGSYTGSGAGLTSLPANQFAASSFTSGAGQCLYPLSATAIGTEACSLLLSGSYVSLSPGSQQTGFLNLSGAGTFGGPLSIGGAFTGATTGSFSASLRAASVASGTQSYVAPVYSNAGAALGSTVHTIFYSCTFAAGTTCAVTLTGTSTGQFASATSYACAAPDMGTSTTPIAFVVGNKAAGSFTVYALTSNSDTVYGTCTGT